MTQPSSPNPSSSPKIDTTRLKNYIIDLVERELERNPPPVERWNESVRRLILKGFEQTKVKLEKNLLAQLLQDIQNELAGYGPLTPFLNDPEVSEVMVNGAEKIYVEKGGKLIKTEARFQNEAHVRRIINRIILPLGRRVDADHPTVDARLPDGSRVNAVIPPVAIDGSTITIRKFGKEKLGVDDLIALGSITENMAEFLRACVVSRLNIVISGGTGSGKTTLLNVLSSFIPEDERIVTIEDAAELKLQQEHVVRLETKAPNPDGSGAVPIRALVRNALRMRPDRIVVGEVRGGEALDMLQAMNTGHDGSLTTLHANSPRDALSRLETMTLMSGLDLPLRVIREQIASAVDLIVQVSRLKDGSRKVTYITEISGMEGDRIVMTDIFKFTQTGMENGKIVGELEPTGMRPLFISRLQDSGFDLGPQVFAPKVSKFKEDPRRRRR